MLRLITACNEGYYRRMTPYLDSLKRYFDFPATLVTVGFEPEYCVIDHVHLTRIQNAGAPYETESPQHGAFLQVIEGPDDEVLVFTDGDIVLQRPLSQIEIAQLLSVSGVACGYNSGPNETMAVEGARLFPRVTPLQLSGRMGEIVNTAPCYNIGVIAARRSVWKNIYGAYMPLWKTVTEAFGHAARQQWLVNYVIALLGIRVHVMSYGLHANGHYGIPPGVSIRDGLAYYQDELVAFRHKL